MDGVMWRVGEGKRKGKVNGFCSAVPKDCFFFDHGPGKRFRLREGSELQVCRPVAGLVNCVSQYLHLTSLCAVPETQHGRRDRFGRGCHRRYRLCVPNGLG